MDLSRSTRAGACKRTLHPFLAFSQPVNELPIMNRVGRVVAEISGPFAKIRRKGGPPPNSLITTADSLLFQFARGGEAHAGDGRTGSQQVADLLAVGAGRRDGFVETAQRFVE